MPQKQQDIVHINVSAESVLTRLPMDIGHMAHMQLCKITGKILGTRFYNWISLTGFINTEPANKNFVYHFQDRSSVEGFVCAVDLYLYHDNILFMLWQYFVCAVEFLFASENIFCVKTIFCLCRENILFVPRQYFVCPVKIFCSCRGVFVCAVEFLI